MNKRSRQERSPRVAAKKPSPVAYQITTMHSMGISQAFATLEGAQRALPTVRQVHPDAFITQLSGPGVHGT